MNDVPVSSSHQEAGRLVARERLRALVLVALATLVATGVFSVLRG